MAWFTGSALVVGVLGLQRAAGRLLVQWQRYRRERRELEQLSERQLHDVGIRRDEIRRRYRSFGRYRQEVAAVEREVWRRTGSGRRLAGQARQEPRGSPCADHPL